MPRITSSTASRTLSTRAPFTRAPSTRAPSTRTSSTRSPASRLPTSSFPIERFTLRNGLRVVVQPDRSAPVVAITMVYDVGFRSEPEGRTGFAHLFEHLMFEGSYSLPKMEHARLVQGNGGTMNGSTRTDYTNYFEELPSSALELGLFLEADRMRAVRLDDETLANQIAVVKEEIRVNVLNRPYGGFPWIDLPPVMFDTFNNAHNGYGSFVDLDAATVEDAADFFDRYYSPANAVLCVAGDTTTEQVHELAERHFGIVDPRPAPVLPSFHEPIRPAAEQRHVAQVDPQAPTPALAAAWRVPDPIGQLEEYLACVVLVEVLTSGDTSRLHRRLVRDDRLVTQVDGMLGTFGDPFDVRDPTMLQLMAYHLDGSQAPAILDAIDEEVAKVAGGLDQDEVDRVVTTLVAGGFRSDDHVMQRSLTMAVLEQQRGRAELLSELPGLVMAVTADDVSAAAATWLGATGRAVLRVEAGAAR